MPKKQLKSESEEQRCCSFCNNIPNSIICLLCNHNACLECATQLIFSKAKIEDTDISKLKCAICKKITKLSEEVQNTLIEFLNEKNYEDDENGVPSNNDEKESAETSKIYNSSSKKNKEEAVDDDEVSVSDSKKLNPANNMDYDEDENEEFEEEDNRNLSLHFACNEHPNEEYSYYSPFNKKLFCAICILNGKNAEEIGDIKSLKNSYAIILHHFQDMVTNVEVSEGLLLNRKKDIELKTDDLKTKISSLKNYVELKFDEVIEKITFEKETFLKSIDDKIEDGITEHAQLLEDIENRINYFSAVIKKVKNIKKKSNKSQEDLLGFFFANQDKIYENINESGFKNRINELIESCEVIQEKINKEVKDELLKKSEQIYNITYEILNDGPKNFKVLNNNLAQTGGKYKDFSNNNDSIHKNTNMTRFNNEMPLNNEFINNTYCNTVKNMSQNIDEIKNRLKSINNSVNPKSNQKELNYSFRSKDINNNNYNDRNKYFKHEVSNDLENISRRNNEKIQEIKNKIRLFENKNNSNISNNHITKRYYNYENNDMANYKLSNNINLFKKRIKDKLNTFENCEYVSPYRKLYSKFS